MDKLDIIDKAKYEKLIKYRNSTDPFGKQIGIEITSLSEGCAKGELTINKNHLNPVNSVHGGCLFTMADIIGGAAAWSRGDDVVTTSSNITYLNPALGSRKLIAVAREIKYGKKISVYDIDIYDEKDRLIAKATNSYYNLGKKIEIDRE